MERNEDDCVKMQDRREEGTQVGTIVEIMRMMMDTVDPDGNLVIMMMMMVVVCMIAVVIDDYGVVFVFALAFATMVVLKVVALLVDVVAVCSVV